MLKGGIILKILIVHGPNINLTGTREPDKYGNETIDDINDLIKAEAAGLGMECAVEQSNHEGVIIDMLHAAMGVYDGVIIN
ncbi:MAG: 3-dehydroquinate dehydratase, partial [Oscillospiraceae bacterium]|nr:3-dehydroquinate dehydratase [Oscillospiraceae bacterium]